MEGKAEHFQETLLTMGTWFYRENSETMVIYKNIELLFLRGYSKNHV